jgi:predicted RNase H-like HicB family nuclease
MRYMVVIEQGPKSWGAYVPDLPGCAAVGESKEEVLELIQGAIEFHLEGLREDGELLPEPHSEVDYVEVSAV